MVCCAFFACFILASHKLFSMFLPGAAAFREVLFSPWKSTFGEFCPSSRRKRGRLSEQQIAAQQTLTTNGRDLNQSEEFELANLAQLSRIRQIVEFR